MEKDLIFSRLCELLPAFFTRKTASQMLGGYISVGTLSNLDSKSQGPPRVKSGKKTLYERTSFVTWLRSRVKESGNGQKITNNSHEEKSHDQQ